MLNRLNNGPQLCMLPLSTVVGRHCRIFYEPRRRHCTRLVCHFLCWIFGYWLHERIGKLIDTCDSWRQLVEYLAKLRGHPYFVVNWVYIESCKNELLWNSLTLCNAMSTMNVCNTIIKVIVFSIG